MSSAAIYSGRVYVGGRMGTSEGAVYSFDAFTGEEIWRFDAGPVSSSPSVTKGIVYVGSDDRNLHALDAMTGDLVGKYTVGQSYGAQIFSSPTVVGGRVYFGAYDHNVYCLDSSTGALIWNYTTSGIVSGSPAVSDGRVYIGYSPDVFDGDDRVDEGDLLCLDAETGEEIWVHVRGIGFARAG